MKNVNRILCTFLLVCIFVSFGYQSATADSSSSVSLTSQQVMSSTNAAGSQTDVAAGDWKDAAGNLHEDALKFWVIHADGYSEKESIRYKLSPDYEVLDGTVSASENCAKGAEMWVNIYLDNQLVYESGIITRKSGEERFSINISDASSVTIECETSTDVSGYCIVDAILSTEDNHMNITSAGYSQGNSANQATGTRLTTQKMVSSTNDSSQKDIMVGDWKDTAGNLHEESLKFWVIHANGYSDTESIKYKLSPSYETFSGTICASENCAKGAKMWVNIYLDDQLVYVSDTVTRKSGEEWFSLDISDASNVKIECETSTDAHGYCIVDSFLFEEGRTYSYSSGNSAVPITGTKLTTQKMVSSSNSSTQKDVTVGDWKDADGTLHEDALKFWVVHANGYSDTESIKYKLSPSYETLSGTICASENCAKGAEMWVNIYLDDQLVYVSDTVTRKSGEEWFTLDISDASNVKIECETSTDAHGYCIVDSSLS